VTAPPTITCPGCGRTGLRAALRPNMHMRPGKIGGTVNGDICDGKPDATRPGPHAPIPWRLDADGLHVVDADGRAVCRLVDRNAEANALLILKACNTHSMTVAYLDELIAKIKARFEEGKKS
jgi:hypothetical protein